MTIEREVEHRIRAIADTELAGTKHVEHLVEAAKRLAGKPDGTPLLEALRKVVAAERLLRLAYELHAQRDLGISGVLPFAHVVASETYQLGIRAARSLGVRATDGGRWLEPAVFLEPMATPVTYVRGRRARVLGQVDGGMQDLPFPIVLIPWYPRVALGSLTVIHHEIGHNLDEDLEISDALSPVLDAELEVSSQRLDIWSQWCREIVADVFGLMYAGTAFLRELAGWARVLEPAGELSSTTHPYPSVRVALGLECLRLLGVTHPGVEPPEPTGADHRSYLEEAPRVARIVMQSPLAALRDAALQDLAPAVADEQELVLGLAPLVLDKTADLSSVPLRLMPSLARHAVDGGLDAAQVTDRLLAHAANRPLTSAPFREEIYARTTRRALVAPILDEEEGGFKRPPPDLFAKTQRLSFVGATNDSLPKLFAKYLTDGGARKERIDIFFLSVPAVRRLAHRARTAEECETLQKTALAELDPALMSRIAASWRILVHDDPYYFAAYFDADAAGGRIHVSAHGWGQDIKRAPAADHTWPAKAAAPGRTYTWYLEALNGLHQRATLLRSSVQS